MSPNQDVLGAGLSSRAKEDEATVSISIMCRTMSSVALVSLNSGIRFYGNIPLGERREWYISYDFTCSMMDERFS